MNKVLELKGNRFQQSKKNNFGGGVNINSKVNITCSKLKRLSDKLRHIIDFWEKENKPFDGVLISVYYNKIVAKSNRISGIFKRSESNNSIVGAKFNDNKTKHIITYYLDLKDLINSVELINESNNILFKYFNGEINKKTFDDKNKFKSSIFNNSKISKSHFRNIISDISYIDDFEIDRADLEIKKSLVTLYNTGHETKELLKKLGIDILGSRIINNQTVYLDDIQLKVLMNKAPYLVSMATIDFSKLEPFKRFQSNDDNIIKIPSPKNEPTIGVIDTLFDERVYFSEWVEFIDLVDDNIPKNNKDYNHGTAVSSLIVDGPRLNPWLEDNCGRFKVRHFGVAVGKEFSSFIIIKQIKNIVLENPDIKVWNLSFGSNQEINDNFISAEASVLDQIQYENDVIFVIAGTNKPNDDIVKIGSPADSINSLVVNSVSIDGISAKYSRRGLSLSFYSKPDISYYGGTQEKYIQVCEPLGESSVSGTSYAAPWIARKLSYLINIMGLNREVAKALIIDSARDWKEKSSPEEISLYGHGIVPIDINDIIETKPNEIKFVITDISEKWNTYNYNFPIPLVDDKYPFIAKATMCYFPRCDRTQGVDYTNTELNLHFGRIKNGKIHDIKGDNQNQDLLSGNKTFYILEKEARDRFRKWDNVKYIVEKNSNKSRPRKKFDNNSWGMEIKTNNRLDYKDGVGLRFGVVVTLKELNGINRIDEFKRNFSLKGWLVNEININERLELFNKFNENINLL